MENQIIFQGKYLLQIFVIYNYKFTSKKHSNVNRKNLVQSNQTLAF